MPAYAIFEDGELIEQGFTDEAAAEDHADHMRALPLAGAGTYEVKQLCPEHADHGVDDCPDFLMLELFLEKLKH